MDEAPDGAVSLTLLKYTVLLATFPLWGPFAKALWEEFVYAMRADGGLTGREPGPRERKEIEEQIAREEPRQVHELLAHHRMMVAQGRGSAAPESLEAPDEKRPGPVRAGSRAGGRASGRPAPRPSAPAARGFRR